MSPAISNPSSIAEFRATALTLGMDVTTPRPLNTSIPLSVLQADLLLAQQARLDTTLPPPPARRTALATLEDRREEVLGAMRYLGRREQDDLTVRPAHPHALQAYAGPMEFERAAAALGMDLRSAHTADTSPTLVELQFEIQDASTARLRREEQQQRARDHATGRWAREFARQRQQRQAQTHMPNPLHAILRASWERGHHVDLDGAGPRALGARSASSPASDAPEEPGSLEHELYYAQTFDSYTSAAGERPVLQQRLASVSRPLFSAPEENECVICAEELVVERAAPAAETYSCIAGIVDEADAEAASPALKLDKCGHTFHTHCLTSWLLNSNTCPLCRRRVVAEDVRGSGDLWWYYFEFQDLGMESHE